MGYTTAIKIKDAKTRAKAFNFLQKNYVPWSKLFNEEYEYVREPLASDLSYDHDPDIVGFDYSFGPGSTYVTYILRIIAIKLGINHTRYDGEEEPITWKLGNPLDRRLFRSKKIMRIVERELKRIEELWDAQMNEEELLKWINYAFGKFESPLFSPQNIFEVIKTDQEILKGILNGGKFEKE